MFWQFLKDYFFPGVGVSLIITGLVWVVIGIRRTIQGGGSSDA